MSKTYIHVNQHILRRNKKLGLSEPPISVKIGKANGYVQRVVIKGPSSVEYTPEKPLSCGATVYIVCESTDLEVYT
jgi:hypothetical protein